VGTAHRERHQAGRASRRAEAVVTAKKQEVVRRFRNIGLVIVGAVALLGLYWFLQIRGNDGSSTATPATTTSSVSATTTTAVKATYGTTECPPAAGATTQTQKFSAPFKQCIDVAKTYTAVITTNLGDLTVKLDPAKAPITVNSFVSLARSQYFDNTKCHRIITGFVVQCGDPTALGTGGPGYTFADELPQKGEYKVGSLAMANSGANTNGSQFFIITGAQGVALDPNYSKFGEVTAGSDTTLKALDAVGSTSGTPASTVTITKVRITES
jgi:peptidyl-prolyl cis-trans isomerase B (cyclophilin B)